MNLVYELGVTSYNNELSSFRIWSSPKCSFRSTRDFCSKLHKIKSRESTYLSNNNKTKVVDVFLCRNPYKRLVSGYLNKYIEHTKYEEASLKINQNVVLHPFEGFVDSLCNKNDGLRVIDRKHFKPQIWDHEGNRFSVTPKMVFNSDRVSNVFDFFNNLYETEIAESQLVRKAVGIKSQHDHDPSTKDSFNVDRHALSDLVYSKSVPKYSTFYNDSIKTKVYNFYKDDFDFFKHLLDSSKISQELYQELTVI